MNRELFIVGQELRARLQWLVTARHDGKVARAARAWGVAQPTLQRFLAGSTVTVNAEVVRRAAMYERVSTDWLLQGTGTPPEPFPEPCGAARRWHHVVDSLNLSPDTRRAVDLLPNQIRHAAHYLCWHGGFAACEPNVSYEVAMEAMRGASIGATFELDAWTALLEGLIAAYGTDAVAAKLTAEVDLVRLGFKPFTSHLFWMNRITDLGATFDEHAPVKVPGTMTHPPKTPVAPPLELPRIQQGRAKVRDPRQQPMRKRGRR